MSDVKKMELTEEMKAKILESGAFPLSANAAKDCTPSWYSNRGIPAELTPTFTLKPFTQKQKDEWSKMQLAAGAEIRRRSILMPAKEKEELTKNITKLDNESDSDYEVRKQQHIAYVMAVAYSELIPKEKMRKFVCDSIAGWSNFLNSSGELIEYKGGKSGLDIQYRPMIHDGVIDELAGYLNKISCLMDVEYQGLES